MPSALSAATPAASTPSLRPRLGDAARALLPLRLRMRLAVWLGRRGDEWRGAALLRDLAERDLNAYHRFLWANHLAYARTYEPEQRFGPEHVHPSRTLLFHDLRALLERTGLSPERDVRSVLDVGCSLGYLLRHLETEVCTAATVLDGVDIDAYAVESGSKRLAAEGSRARLVRGDATELPRLFPGRRYDLVLCAGVLMYLRQADAAAAVREMLACCRGVVAFAGLAHPEMDNRHLAASVTRDRDRSLIHNLDAMVAAAGGNVVSRRWEGARQVQGNTLYFVFARPASSEESHGESEDALASTFRLASPASSSAGRPQSKAGGFIPPAAAATSSIELAESTDAIASPASPKSLAGAGSSGGAP